MKNFRTYDLAISFYKQSRSLSLPAHLKDQFARASSSIALNLAEGRGKRTRADQIRFFHIALGSARECEAIFALNNEMIHLDLADRLDHLVGCICLLIKRAL